MKSASFSARGSRFLLQPHRTILFLTLPILLSMIAEPVTGLVDTGFVARLGTAPLASLGVGAGALSSIFWIFGFLGVATQTEVAQAYGRRDLPAAVNAVSLALMVGLLLSLLLSALLIPGASLMARALGGAGEVLSLSTGYIQLRLIGAPGVIITIVGFGALRGVQDMKTPLLIALGINAANIVLDILLIFGGLGIPPLGVAGAALASSLSQWLGAAWMLWELRRRLGLTREINLRDGLRLLRVGKDLFIRTGSLTLFTLVATRAATQLGAEAGAAHQVIRQLFFFTALLLDAFGNTAQSLIGYYYGGGRMREAKKVALTAAGWGLGSSALLTMAMLAAAPLIGRVLVPADAVPVFAGAWTVFALSLPLSALAFITDGILWGASDYGYMRNAMLIATACGLIGLQMVADESASDFLGVWLATALWIGIRATLGALRVYPGIGRSPFRQRGGD